LHQAASENLRLVIDCFDCHYPAKSRRRTPNPDSGHPGETVC